MSAMNEAVAVEGLTSLRQVDPDEAAFASALCALMRHAGLDVRVVDARLASPWFAVAEHLQFHVAAIAERAVPLSAERVADTVAALDAVDPILVAIEGALGVSMDAAAMVAVTPLHSIMLSLGSGGDTVFLAVPTEHERRDGWIDRAAKLPPSDMQLPCVIRIDAAGPRLTIAEASDLDAGDLVLIADQLRATLTHVHFGAFAGVVELNTGRFAAGQNGALMSEETNDFLVPLTIRLPDRMTSAAALASLVPGTTLPLGPLTSGMPVELRVADRLLAHGELVQIGDRFAVLIESRADIADPVVAEDAQ